MMKIKNIWQELTDDHTVSHGLLYRRYAGSVIPDVYVAVQHPENYLCIYIAVTGTAKVDISEFSNLQEINVDFYSSPNEKDKNILIFKLLNLQHEDIFAVLCEDLIETIRTEKDEKKIIKEVLNRFEKWKSLFTKIGKQGLLAEEQRGLFGELYFLRMFLQKNENHLSVVNTWIGPDKEVRDFQFLSWAVEVKTTKGNNHQKVHISSERQLDTSHLDNLFLFHLSLDQQQKSGETLNQIVDSVSQLLQSNSIALTKFQNKLFEFGYFYTQRDLYDDVGYHIRNGVFYEVKEDFPRIEENEIRKGVGDVKYSVIVSQCGNYEVDSDNVFSIVKL